ncbi:hypothetical protein GCM10023336_20250 [Streptomyces similanensis]|uniref:Uncharacterized protein n=1 Tax=Streptomyces similanensis TaxID=1274988 RepID=A0ABP9K776_9ACTN
MPSVAASNSAPSHDGASATAPVTERYADADAPPVTSIAPASPRPPGDSRMTTAAPAHRTPDAPSSRAAAPYLFRGSRSMSGECRSAGRREPGPKDKDAP